ncbi:alanine racemase [Roseomonas sp. NAR14]|uniref:Alanine racemase n=1 Tax=Roseomonas acroporae TaxID=2937791 RepID=A0A9X2BY19_9PROT|nr:alanine racemase [Roseomonas acroporae]MCK8785550.1 alanine racemase [Roseomonas acroporae]
MTGVLTVDLGAIVANWRNLRARHAAMGGGGIAGVVKADGYGLGAAAVAGALLEAGCRHFFVALEEEGLALREALGAAPGKSPAGGTAAPGSLPGPPPVIAVLNGFAPGGEADRAGLVPVLNGLGEVEAHAAAARAAGVARPAFLHVDTGMARLGLPPAELEALAADPGRLDGLRLLAVMTHLACADEPSHPMNALQAGRFAAACAALPAAPRSFANSSGLFLGPAFASDLARPGCATYGINPTPGHPNPMRPTVTLTVPVLQVREVPPGATAGYGAAWTATRPTRIATVAAGYADGYMRALAGRAAGLIGTQAVPLLGRVSMDLTLFDVTDLPPGLAVRPGDRLTLVGGPADGPASPDALALAAGTIGYEILTGLGRRHRRAYLPAGTDAADRLADCLA